MLFLKDKIGILHMNLEFLPLVNVIDFFSMVCAIILSLIYVDMKKKICRHNHNTTIK